MTWLAAPSVQQLPGDRAGMAIDVTAAQLAQTTFQSGSGTDDLWVRANDGTDWGAWKEFHVAEPVDAKPVVTGGDVSLASMTRSGRQHCSR